MDGKFLSDKTKDLLVGILDELTKVKLLEPLDGPMYRIVINKVDQYADTVVPDVLDDQINAAAELALEGHYELAAEHVGIIIDELVDIEAVNDEIEKLVFVDGLKFLVRQLQLYIEKKRNE